MLLSYGAFLLIIPPPGGGGVNKDCLPAGPFFFVLNYPTPRGKTTAKRTAEGGSFLHFPVDTGADIRYRYR